MGLNDTPVSSRFTIGIFGRRNAGKSSLINAITAQDIALTSDVPGTTTDPVQKTMEILPIGPVVIIDTAGLDDVGELGEKRVEKSYEALRKCHLVLLVLDSTRGSEAYGELERAFMEELRARKIACVIAWNKNSLASQEIPTALADSGYTVIPTDAVERTGIEELKKAIIANARVDEEEVGLTDGIVEAGDVAILVTPIDSAAPKGRLILPQQQVLRDILDKGAVAFVTKETELAQTLAALANPPKVVITDSQAFKQVAAIVPKEVPLTSFSILFSRQKGDLEKQLEGIRALKSLKPGDRILMSEGCTHHRQSDDIGTVKIPRMVRAIEPDVEFEWSSGAVFPKDLEKYKMIIHCGACMVGRREMQYRINYAGTQDVPLTNYGMVIGYATGVLERALKPFGLEV